MPNSIEISDYITRPPFNFLFAYNSDSKNPETWKSRFEKVENKSNLGYSTLILDIATTIMFPDPTNMRDFKCFIFPVRECDIIKGGSTKKVLGAAKPNLKKNYNGTTYYSINHFNRGENFYSVAMPERALLNFLINLMDLIEEIPKHQYFNVRKYLDNEYSEVASI